MQSKTANLDLSMSALRASSQFTGGNAPYLEELYEQYLHDPNSVSPEWRTFFTELPQVDGIKQDVPHSTVRRYFRELARHPTAISAAKELKRHCLPARQWSRAAIHDCGCCAITTSKSAD